MREVNSGNFFYYFLMNCIKLMYTSKQYEVVNNKNTSFFFFIIHKVPDIETYYRVRPSLVKINA